MKNSNFSCGTFRFPSSLGPTIIVGLTFVSSLFAKSPPITGYTDAPWLTGPLFSPSAHITPVGIVNLEPYYFSAYTYEAYDSNWKKVPSSKYWTNTLQLYATVGLADWMDFTISPSGYYSRSRGRGAFGFNDLSMGFNFQLLVDREDNYLPGLKLGIREVFPTGRYQKLDPHKNFTDAAGLGSYQTILFLCAGRQFHFRGDHWLNLRLGADYIVATRVHVRGFNSFGGGRGANAYVYVPQGFDVDLSYEWTFTKHWAFACDNIMQYSAATKFKGYAGRLDNGEPADLSWGSWISFSMAPAIEYNWNADIGIISGVWFSLAGRNTDVFAIWSTGVNLSF